MRSLHPFGDLAVRARETGFEPVPMDGKKPMLQGWNGRPLTVDGIKKLLEKQPHYASANMGFRSGELLAIDIDIEDQREADRVQHLAFGILGPTPFIRMGRRPRRMLFYRIGAPIPSRTIGRVEILSAGKVPVVFGVHPTTGQAYYWPDECLLDVEFDDVPYTEEWHLERFFGQLGENEMHRQMDSASAEAKMSDRDGSMPDPVPDNMYSTIGSNAAEQSASTEIGNRNNILFRHLKARAAQCASIDDLRELARIENETFEQPLPVQEVEFIVKSVWKYRSEGKLILAGRQSIVLPFGFEELKQLTGNTAALFLYCVLKATRNQPVFEIPQQTTAKYLGWGTARLNKAIAKLLEMGLLNKAQSPQRVGRRNTPTKYKFGV